jgi:hypothetical protein
MNHESPDDPRTVADANVERLLGCMTEPATPDSEFVDRLRGRLLREAGQLAAGRQRPATSTARQRFRRAVLAVGALAAAFVAGVWTARQFDRPDTPVPEQADATEPRPVRLQPVAVAEDAVSADVSPVSFRRPLTTVGPDAAVCVSYQDIEVDHVSARESELPTWLTALAGRRVRIRGFMRPPFQETGLRGFHLTRDDQFCCFGPSPRPCDVIRVTLRDGTTTDYIPDRPFDVVGTFRVEPQSAPDGTLEELYRLQDAVLVQR